MAGATKQSLEDLKEIRNLMRLGDCSDGEPGNEKELNNLLAAVRVKVIEIVTGIGLDEIFSADRLYFLLID